VSSFIYVLNKSNAKGANWGHGEII